jgi:hypothetical protein
MDAGFLFFSESFGETKQWTTNQPLRVRGVTPENADRRNSFDLDFFFYNAYHILCT